jgi:prepilin-type N-terminal cleavage/methylation domain-containing protein
MKRQSGFTIVELIVVIATIAVLASMVLSNVNQYMVKARDAKRIRDLDSIRKALDMYFSDNGYYPPTGCGWDCNSYYYSNDPGWQALENALKPYIYPLPKDPINNVSAPWVDGRFSYAYGNVMRNSYSPSYDLTAQLETPNHPLACVNKCWRWYANQNPWCTSCGGSYSNQIFEASPQY